MRALLLALAVLPLAVPAAAQPMPGNCETGQARADLDISNVRARLFNHGNLFWDGDPNVYTVPKAGGVNAIYNAGLWLGGKVNGELRMAAARYDNYEFWPGPLLEDGSLPNPGDCSAYDRIWTVSVLDIERYERTGEATTDLAEWPVVLGAPVVDGDGIAGNYDLAAGDRPEIYGAQTAWWVMNDVGNAHRETETPPLGVEVRVTAFARPDANPFLDDATFYRYEVINRSGAAIDSLFYAMNADPDLGQEAGDDYIGSDSLRSLGFVYNADNEDFGGYGLNPPAFGFDLLDGASVFGYYNSSGSPTGDPVVGPGYYNVMSGFFRLGQPYTFGGAGDSPANPPTKWVYTGVPGTYWSEPCPTLDSTGECGQPAQPDDRRYTISGGPRRLDAGDTMTVHVAMLWARGACNYGCEGSSVDQLYAASDAVQAMHNAGQLFVPGEAAITLAAPALTSPDDGATDLDLQPGLHWAPVPGATRYSVEVAVDADFRAVVFQRALRETAVVADVPDGGPLYWRVRAEAPGALSPWSETRSFSQYAPVRSGFVAFEGGLAAVEVAGPAGADPCGPGAVSPDGCDVLGANLVYESPNSTGEWLLQEAPLRYPDHPFLSGDLEIRFTEAGSVAFYFGNPLPRSRFVRVPFEVWDTGRAAGPEDDRQLVARVQVREAGDPCRFAFGEGDTVRVGGVPYPATPDVRALGYRGDHDYAAWAALAADSLAGQDCALVGPALGSTNETVYLASSHRPVFRFVAQETTREVPGEGTVVRVVGNKPGAADLALTADLSALDGASDVRIAVDPAAGVTDADLAAALDGLTLVEDAERPGLYAATARAQGPTSRLPRSAVFRLVVDGQAEPLDRVLTLSGLEPDIDFDGVAERADSLTYGVAEPAGPWTAAPSARSAVVAGRAVAADYAARAGDVVAAFDAVGRVAGAAPVAFVPDGEGGARPVVWLRLYGDDPATPEDEGLTDGEAFTLRLAGFRSGGVRGTEPLGPWSDAGGAPLPGLGDPGAELAFPVVLAVEEESVPEPVAWRLAAPYPNPSRGAVRVEYALGQAGEARVEVFDVLGRRVAVLAEGRHEAGPHAATWEAGGVASGVYIVRLAGAGTAQTRKVAVVR